MIKSITSALPYKVLALMAGASVCALATVAGAQTTTPPNAQDATQPTKKDTKASSDVTEVIVTGQRRNEKLQNVSIAETALSGSQLQDKKIETISDLQNAAPALTIGDTGLVNAVNIRGIGLASGNPNVANGVATYVDGLFQPPIVQGGNFFDIGSVEILRGPQGTLVGSNSTGGAVLINSANPKLGDFGGYAQGQVGSFDDKGVEGALNLPVTGNLAFRLAGHAEDRDSFDTDLGPYHNTAGSLHESGGRLGALWSDGPFQALFKVEEGERSTGGYAWRPIPGIPGVQTAPGDDYDYDYNTPTFLNTRYVNNNLELKYTTDSGIVFRSLTGYQDKHSHSLSDLTADGVGTPTTQDQTVRERESSQEFNIISPTTGQFSWILGAYYQHNMINVDIFQAPVVYISINPNKTTTGLFGQFNYKFTDKVEVQFGVRESTFKESGPQTDGVYLFSPPLTPGALNVAALGGREHDQAPTGKLSLNYKPDRNNLFYVFVARGYKSGGFNASQVFQPEYVWNQEVGWKSTLFDNHLKTQVDAFNNDYTNFQADGFDPTTGQADVVNMPKSTIKGVEGQAQARFGGFSLDGGFAFVDSHLGKVVLVNQQLLPNVPGGTGPQCPVGTPSNPPVCFDYGPYLTTGGGGPNLYSPKWTYNLSASYEFNLGGQMRLIPRVNMSHQDSSYTTLIYAKTAYLPARTLYSALVTLETPTWMADLYGTNLTRAKYVSGITGTNEFFGAPFQVGLRIRKDF